MNTEEIFKLSLEMSGLKEAPGDSMVHVPGENIKKIAIGIDIEVGDLLLAKELGVDCVICHHPQGENRLRLYEVMDNQIALMKKAGVPLNEAQKALERRKMAIKRASHPVNYDKVTRAAELLGMPFIGIHSPADLIGESYLQKYVDDLLRAEPEMVLEELIGKIKEIGEYKNAKTEPLIVVGHSKSYVGKALVAMAGGTNGGEDVFKAYFRHGIGTMLVMHLPESVKKAVEEQNIGNVIVAGHMASDSLGLNIFLDELEKKGLELLRFGGVIER